jgi:hypothetical protein
MQLTLFANEPINTAKLELITSELSSLIHTYRFQGFHIARIDEYHPAFAACLEIAALAAQLGYLLGRTTSRYSSRTAESWNKQATQEPVLRPIEETLRCSLPECLLDFKVRSEGFYKRHRGSIPSTIPQASKLFDKIYLKTQQIPTLYEQYFDRFSVKA